MNFSKKIKNIKFITAIFSLTLFGFTNAASAQSFAKDVKRESARSDTLTGGKIEKTPIIAGEGDIKITLNVPAFQLTLWQNGKEVKSYPVGVGLKDHPIFLGSRRAGEIIWNPDWIPPSSDWVEESKNVKPGEVIRASDARNPLGKIKIPLGSGYLIHQAKGVADLGSLVSHGCVRVLQTDLYDLSEKIVAARALSITKKQIENAKRTKNTFVAPFDSPVPVEITYDTQVIEAGQLHIYPDVYDYNKNTAQNLRAELESNGIETSKLTDKTLENMMARATAKKQFVVAAKSIAAGRALRDGRTLSVVTRTGAAPSRKVINRVGNRRVVSR